MKKYNFLQESFFPFGMGFKRAAIKSSSNVTTKIFSVLTGPLAKARSFLQNENITPFKFEEFWNTQVVNDISNSLINTESDIKIACIKIVETIHMNLKMQYNNETWRTDCIKALEQGYIKTLSNHVLTSLGLLAVGTLMDM